MKKEVRQAAIERIINQFPISKQEQLMHKLKEAGINATQATISRDIREMNIIKQQDGDKWRYMVYKNDNPNELAHLYELIEDSVTSAEQIQFINIVHTIPSYANNLAAVIDDLKLDSISGTVAGHDTVVIFSANNNYAESVNKMFMDHLNIEL
ncbi:ArgR family transcriptional regulator [Nicoliella spurrieriana]|uniref:Arginine repressor n=1 Tax=Nicoliella spurrieriana TaxID=2925830 RepID=A0A976RRI3_9LACO|nr:ArgR family transcriptional regulator [Nicoliella spurrieriana]UQS86454.1 ArgR family transcriptional regulator [Nicoliella spurrieriana]